MPRDMHPDDESGEPSAFHDFINHELDLGAVEREDSELNGEIPPEVYHAAVERFEQRVAEFIHEVLRDDSPEATREQLETPDQLIADTVASVLTPSVYSRLFASQDSDAWYQALRFAVALALLAARDHRDVLPSAVAAGVPDDDDPTGSVDPLVVVPPLTDARWVKGTFRVALDLLVYAQPSLLVTPSRIRDAHAGHIRRTAYFIDGIVPEWAAFYAPQFDLQGFVRLSDVRLTPAAGWVETVMKAMVVALCAVVLLMIVAGGRAPVFRALDEQVEAMEAKIAAQDAEIARLETVIDAIERGRLP